MSSVGLLCRGTGRNDGHTHAHTHAHTHTAVIHGQQALGLVWNKAGTKLDPERHWALA